jgi:predicted Na+-dependent transporter
MREPGALGVGSQRQLNGARGEGAQARAWRLLQENYLAVGLLVMLTLGALWPAPGSALDDTPAATILIAAMFFTQGVFLETSQLRDAVRAWRANAVGVVSILGLTASLGFVLVRLPLRNEYRVGLAIFSGMSTTTTSGLVLSELAGANFGLALFLTVTSAFVSVVTVPFFLPLVIRSATSVSVSSVALLLQLVLMVIVPLLAGKSLQLLPRLVAPLQRYRKSVKLTASLALILVPYIKISASADKLRLLSALDILWITLASTGFHCTCLALNAAIATAMRLPLPFYRAFVIVCSQKTMGTAVAVLGSLPAESGVQGLVVIAILIPHFVQMIIDSAIASRWASDTRKQAAVAAAAALADSEHAAVAAATAADSDTGRAPDSGRVAIELAAPSSQRQSALALLPPRNAAPSDACGEEGPPKGPAAA